MIAYYLRVLYLFLILYLVYLTHGQESPVNGSDDDISITSTLAASDDPAKPLPIRDRSHIEERLRLGKLSMFEKSSQVAARRKILDELVDIYQSSVEPSEQLYRFHDLNRSSVTGPWSTGKSTIINYLLGIEGKGQALYTGAEPTTSDFTVITYGEKYKTVEGLVLVTDTNQPFSDLEKYGQAFLEKLQGYEMSSPLLEKLTIVDTPGIIENRKQQERGYPFNQVMKFFVDRADLIFVVFDPSKLDVGTELESTFKQLKGRESQIRLILNKADTISSQELMRVYGALFWNFAPLISVVEPPRVYIGSYWSKAFRPATNHELFYSEEVSLLRDLYDVVSNSVENKIAAVRQHANRVLVHVCLVDKFIEVFTRERTLFGDNVQIWKRILDNPDQYNIYHSVTVRPYVSKYDLPGAEIYREFFRVNTLSAFKPLSAHCRYLSGCLLDHLTAALATRLPALLATCQRKLKKMERCDKDLGDAGESCKKL